jgi:hypothetical protein
VMSSQILSHHRKKKPAYKQLRRSNRLQTHTARFIPHSSMFGGDDPVLGIAAPPPPPGPPPTQLTPRKPTGTPAGEECLISTGDASLSTQAIKFLSEKGYTYTRKVKKREEVKSEPVTPMESESSVKEVKPKSPFQLQLDEAARKRAIKEESGTFKDPFLKPKVTEPVEKPAAFQIKLRPSIIKK